MARGAQREVAEVLRGGGQHRGVRGRQAAPRGGAGGVRDGAHDLQLLYPHIQHQVCMFFSTIFSKHYNYFSRVAYLDHQKVHQPELAQFTCEKCRERFVVESVYLAHLRGHRAPYSSTKLGSFRCNGCCQYFRNRAGNKPSRSFTTIRS